MRSGEVFIRVSPYFAQSVFTTASLAEDGRPISGPWQGALPQLLSRSATTVAPGARQGSQRGGREWRTIGSLLFRVGLTRGCDGAR